ncbi:VOC family protein [Belliella kenyensis]|uniref:VOC family protein n=2 Tax=Belliella kenyensis TaxID=1472724 RepID=A0ABV8EJ60_9BACT|nr:VOC family protein [Belliella kenyensis]
MMSQKVKAQAKITHIAVFVSNLEQSTAFYKDVMDFEEIEEPFKDGLHAWFDIGNNLQLHVIEDKWQPITINKNNHICFSIPDMDVFISKLNDKNVAFENWVGEKGKINVRPDGIKQVYLRDPDGYWIEINNEYN